MSKTWPIVPIRMAYSGLFDGPHATPKPSDEGPVFLGIGNITEDGHLDLTQTKRISEEDFPKWTKRVLPRGGDIVFTYEATLNRYAIVPQGFRGCLGRRLALIRPNPEAVDTRWLHYYFFTSEWRAVILANTLAGATVDRIPLTTFPDFPVRLPDLPTQRRIASILSAYDDLIENNMRRIAILEKMARSIYEEWFVRFRFPGHEQAKMVKSELGLIPEGWPIVAASDAITINPKVRVPKEGLKPFVPMGALSERSMLISEIEQREGNSGTKFQNGDTLFARITPCLENGKTGFVQFLPTAEAVAFGSTEFIVLRSKTLCPEYVYALARSNEFRGNAIKSMSGATGRQRVKEACFDGFLLAQPDAETLGRFREAVRPMFSIIRILAQKNTNLSTTRNLLLPKLIEGSRETYPLNQSTQPTVTLTIEGELTEDEAERIRGAFSQLVDFYYISERKQSLPSGYIGFLTKEELRKDIQCFTEVIRQNAVITAIVLTPIFENVALNVMSNLVTDVYKEAFSASAKQNIGSRESKGTIKYLLDDGAICGALNSAQLADLISNLKGTRAVITCNGTDIAIQTS